MDEHQTPDERILEEIFEKSHSSTVSFQMDATAAPENDNDNENSSSLLRKTHTCGVNLRIEQQRFRIVVSSPIISKGPRGTRIRNALCTLTSTFPIVIKIWLFFTGLRRTWFSVTPSFVEDCLCISWTTLKSPSEFRHWKLNSKHILAHKLIYLLYDRRYILRKRNWNTWNPSPWTCQRELCKRHIIERYKEPDRLRWQTPTWRFEDHHWEKFDFP